MQFLGAYSAPPVSLRPQAAQAVSKRLPPPRVQPPRPTYATLRRSQQQQQAIAMLGPTASDSAVDRAATGDNLPQNGDRPSGITADSARGLTPSGSRPFKPVLDFDYSDRDNFEAEINEFYNYQDNPYLQEGQSLFNAKHPDEWKSLGDYERESAILELLDQLELKSSEARYAAAKQLLYIAQGCFGNCNSKSEQLEWIQRNNQTLLHLGAFSLIRQALQVVSHTLDVITRLSTGEAGDGGTGATGTGTSSMLAFAAMSLQERQATIDLANAEISTYLSLCYMMVEVNLNNGTMRDELWSGSAPFVAFLFDLVDQLGEGNRKHYPVKKLLLLVWKTLLATVGSVEILETMKAHSRLVEGLPPVQADLFMKASAQDFHTFNVLMTNKYPAYYTPDVTAITPRNIPLVEPLTPVSRRFLNQIIANGPVVQPLMTPTHTSQPANVFQRGLLIQSENPEALMPRAFRESLQVMRHNMYISSSALQIAKERIRMDRYESDQMGSSDSDAVDVEHEKQKEARNQHEDLARLSRLYDCLAPQMSTHIAMLVRLLYYINLGNQTGEAQSPNQHSSESLSVASMTPSQKQEYLDKMDLNRHKEVVTKSVSGILLLLVKSFKCDHILKFEYIAQLLNDNNCAILILKMLSTWFQNIPASAVSMDAQLPGAWLLARDEPDELNFFCFCRNALSDITVPNLNHQAQASPPASLREDSNGCTDAADTDSLSGDTAVDSASEASTRMGSPHSAEDAVVPSASLSISSVPQKCSWRNFYTTINLLRILQKLTKNKPHRIYSLVSWKATAVFKRVLKVNHPGLHLYCLKLVKSQIPYMGRKWKINNTKIITSIYLHLRPRLKEEYLGGDLDVDVDEAMAQEQHLRALVAFYHHRHLPDHFPSTASTEGSKAEGSPNTNTAAATKSQSADQDELEMLLAMVRRSHEHETRIPSSTSNAPTSIVGGAVASSDTSLALLPIGKNLYKAEADAPGLDADFMANYETWLEDEVYSVRRSDSLEDDEAEDSDYEGDNAGHRRGHNEEGDVPDSGGLRRNFSAMAIDGGLSEFDEVDVR
ncbi:hypothetical protein DFJ73DRAFT_822709 [Zopfochytrium polystomum]|nr:hypothetical protein DFJ73DRAFT_822709 [Zopfochytrium polystomum]